MRTLSLVVPENATVKSVVMHFHSGEDLDPLSESVKSNAEWLLADCLVRTLERNITSFTADKKMELHSDFTTGYSLISDNFWALATSFDGELMLRVLRHQPIYGDALSTIATSDDADAFFVVTDNKGQRYLLLFTDITQNSSYFLNYTFVMVRIDEGVQCQTVK